MTAHSVLLLTVVKLCSGEKPEYACKDQNAKNFIPSGYLGKEKDLMVGFHLGEVEVGDVEYSPKKNCKNKNQYTTLNQGGILMKLVFNENMCMGDVLPSGPCGHILVTATHG